MIQLTTKQPARRPQESLPPGANPPFPSSETAALIRKHYRMQLGNFISHYREHGGGCTVASDISAVPMWNHSAWFEGATGLSGFLAELERAPLNAARRPAVYVLKTPVEHETRPELFRASGWEPFDQESWMIYRHGSDDSNAGEPIDLVEISDDRGVADFVEVFYAAYQVREPGYAQSLGRQLREPGEGNQIRHFVGYVQGKPVTIGTLIEREGDACIYNVGTIPDVRRKGYGRTLMRHLIDFSERRGHERLFLQVDSGSRTEKLYQRLGFETVFVRAGFRAANWAPPAEKQAKPAGSFPGWVAELGPAASAPREVGIASVQFSWPEISCLVQDEETSRVIPAETVFLAACLCLLNRYSGEDKIEFSLRTAASETGAPVSQLSSAGISQDRPVGVWLQELEARRSNNAIQSIDSGTASASGVSIDLTGAGSVGPSLGDSALEFSWLPKERRWAIHFNRERLDEAVVRRMGAHLLAIVEQIVLNPKTTISALELTTPGEKKKILGEWNQTGAAFDSKLTLSALLEEAAERSPGAPALILAEAGAGQAKTWSYAELHAAANKLARHLRELGIRPNQAVGLCLGRSMELMVALLAVIKAGGTCVPLDPAYPPERLQWLIEDCKASLVLTERKFAQMLGRFSGKAICLQEESIAWERQLASTLDAAAQPNHTAYIIYTSGSTGRPKGVLIPHKAVANHCVDVRRYYELTPRDRVLQFSSINFDAAFEQIFGALSSGACLVLRGEEVWTVRQFVEKAAELRLTVADIPTAYWHQLSQECAREPGIVPPNRLRLVIVGGETMLPETVQLWRQTPFRSARLINAYGPTEATITATAYEVPASGAVTAKIPIGRPRGCRKVYVLDRWQHLAPEGLAGELCIGGELLATGYLNLPQITNDKFMADPFAPTPGAALYRTGDLARWLPDGNLEFLGRLDHQVKIRGYRVEPGEIEAALAEHPGLREAAVTVEGNGPADRRLIGYVVAREPGFAVKELRSFLRQRLPDFMVPAEIVALDRLPLLPSGKVDRRGLAALAPARKPLIEEVKGPSEPLELQIQLIFERVLRRSPIGVDVSFFELGGDSLQALEVIVQIERVTGQSLPLGTLFQASTIEALAQTLRENRPDQAWSCLVPLQPGGSRPPLFFIHTTPGDVLGYGNLIYHLGSDQPCYGFQSLGLGRPELSHTRLEEMAAHYVRLLREFQPHGPYYLGGWCYGGLLAVEMARQLQALGEKIGLLALLETVAPDPAGLNLRYYLHRLGCFFRMKPTGWRIYLAKKIQYYLAARRANKMRFRLAAQGGLNSAADAKIDQRLAQLENIYRVNLRALKFYRAECYPGRVTLFNASEVDPAILPDPEYGWPGLAQEIEVHLVPGNHDTMLAEPHVAVLAEKIRLCLDRAGAGAK